MGEITVLFMESDRNPSEPKAPELARVRATRKRARSFPPHLKKAVERDDNSMRRWIVEARKLRIKQQGELLSMREQSLLDQYLRHIQRELLKPCGHARISDKQRAEAYQEALYLTDPGELAGNAILEQFAAEEIERIRRAVDSVLARRQQARQKWKEMLIESISKDLNKERDFVRRVFDALMEEEY